MIDTHCHLNFSRLVKKAEEVVSDAQKRGVTHIIVPGTDIATSQIAIELSEKNRAVYAAIGIHPHHVFEVCEKDSKNKDEEMLRMLDDLEDIFGASENVVAVGEIGLDRHMYGDTKYQHYSASEEFFKLQETVFRKQLVLARTYDKSVIVHNRESAEQLLSLLRHEWSDVFTSRMVFHCCEPNEDLLRFAQDRHIYIGVDGDVTYDDRKASFIRTVPIELLVLETDSPYLLPEPLRTEKRYPNVPANLPLIAGAVARIHNISVEEVIEQTTHNAQKLFRLHW